MSEVANFLADLHKEGYQSSSLNVFRSAISSVHDKADSVEVERHPKITRLLKGAFHERPLALVYIYMGCKCGFTILEEFGSFC